MSRVVLAAVLVLAPGCDKSGSSNAPAVGEGDPNEPTPPPESEPEELPDVDTTTKVDGALDEAQIQEVIDGHWREVRECFDEALERMEAQNLKGAIVIEFTVGKDGKFSTGDVTESNFGDQETGACILRTMESWAFPKAKKGETTVRYAFQLRSY